MTLTVEILPVGQWAARVADRLQERIRAKPDLRIALPTGHTPRPLYREIADRNLDFSGLEVFLLDEFLGLPRGHPARCDTMLRSDLLELLKLPPRVVHRPEVDGGDLEEMCRSYEELIRDGGLDLTLLGLGENGHVGLNEPGSMIDAETRIVRLSESTVEATNRYGTEGKKLEWGVTLGLRTILASREVWLLVTGTGKAEVLDRVLTGPMGAEVPASFLRGHPNATLFTDEGAAQLIT